MSQSLKSKQWLPISDDEREDLKRLAVELDISVGLLSRALWSYALERIDTASVRRRIEDEKAATTKRVRDGARAAAQERWSTDN